MASGITAAASSSQKPRRARRRLGEDERREQIFDATVSVVAEYGYDGASLARIAGYAQISKGLISHYFADRDDLMTQTVTVTVATIRDSVAAALDLAAPVPTVIRNALRRAADLHHTHRRELATIDQIVHNLRGPDGRRLLGVADYEPTYQAQQRLFERGQAEGSLRLFDTRVMAITYQGAIDTMLGYIDAHPDTDLTLYADQLADLLLDGMTPSGANRE